MRNWLKKIYKKPSGQFLVYDSIKTLPLKLLFEIAETGNLSLLLIAGNCPNLIDVWEKIIKQYGEADGNFDVNTTIEKQNQIVDYAAQYIEVMAMLVYLQYFGYNSEYANRLIDLGYRITQENYEVEAKQYERKVKNLATRIMILQKEIESMKTDKPTTSFEDVIAYLCAALQMNVDHNLTVAQYIAFKKIIKKKHVRTT